MSDAPLPRVFSALPLGAVRAAGWLQDQLRIQADGLTGYVDEFWPSLSESAWKGGAGDAWERGPYYLDGLVPLAYLLDDERLKSKVRTWIEPMLASGRADGWFGPAANKDRWPLAVALKVLTQFHEATGDTRALQTIDAYFRYLQDNPPDWPDDQWRGVRAMENVVSLLWRMDLSPAQAGALFATARGIHANSFDWTRYFLEFPQKDPCVPEGFQFRHWTHVVNVAMAVKYPGLAYRLTGDERTRRAVVEGIANLDQYHGQVGGRFSGDEHLAGKSPSQGTELCAIVEYMFSLEKLIETLGDVALSDRLEMLAYNGLPATCTPDFWAHQYDQQANQVLCTVAKRRWSNNGDASNIFGLEPNFGCCTANMHQGWPKLVSHLWMAAPDGLAAVAYGPSRVQTRVAGGAMVEFEEKTDYPFDGAIELHVKTDRPARFALHLRVPAWAEGAGIAVGSEKLGGAPGTYVRVEREWRTGDVVRIDLPMPLRTERRYNNSMTLLRGPLVMGLRMREQFREVASHHETLPAKDWEIEPASEWKYAIDSGAAMQVTKTSVGRIPFAQEAAPVTVRVKARRLNAWQMENSSAAPVPQSPVRSDAPVEEVELIPYGSTRLRIAEFPVLAESQGSR